MQCCHGNGVTDPINKKRGFGLVTQLLTLHGFYKKKKTLQTRNQLKKKIIHLLPDWQNKIGISKNSQHLGFIILGISLYSK